MDNWEEIKVIADISKTSTPEEAMTILQSGIQELKPFCTKRFKTLEEVLATGKISDIRKYMRGLRAKRSRNRMDPILMARYEEENRLCKKRIDELFDGLEDPTDLSNIAEEPERLAQQYIVSQEYLLKDRLGSMGLLTKDDKLVASIKRKLRAPELLRWSKEWVGYTAAIAPEVIEVIKSRLDRHDRRVETIIKLFNLLNTDDELKQGKLID
jgi:hypothetical protein